MPKTQKVRVLFLISNRWNSAVSEYALSAAESLKRKGFVTSFITLENAPVGKRAKIKGHGLNTVKDFSPLRLFTLSQFIREFAPHAVFCFGGPETFLASALRPFAKWSLFRFRGQDSDMKESQAGFSFRFSHRGLDGIIVPNAILEQKYKSNLKKSVYLIPLGMDEERFFHRETSAGPRRDLLLVGRLDPVKGHDAFFSIYAPIKDVQSTQLCIIGEAANLSGKTLTDSAVAAGMIEGKNFRLEEKRVEDLPERMSAALCGVISSLNSEVICRVGVEFLLSGTPIFVSGAGALEELLFPDAGESYKNLSPFEASKKLAQFIQRAGTETEEERKKRAVTAREMFSLEKMGQKLARLIISDRA